MAPESRKRVAVAIICIGLAWGGPAAAAVLETVAGEACYQYGDRESALEGRAMALGLAKQQAIESHHVLVESATTVANYQLADDIVKSLSRAMLRNMKIVKEEHQGRKICVALTAELDPAEVAALINQRVGAKQVAQVAQAPLLVNPSAFRLKVWTNKEPATFREGERLVIYVWSERDAYLKLDYYQANGEVVHLVPNLFVRQALIKGGQTYAFGGPDSPVDFMVKAPFGAEAVKALAGTQPFGQDLAESASTASATPYLEDLKNRVRGIELRPKKPAGDGATGRTADGELAEAAVALTTTERE